MCAGCHLYFLIGSLTLNVYKDRFLNVNNEFNVTKCKKLKNFFLIFRN